LPDLRALLRIRLPRRAHVERLRDNHALSSALTGITAAVVGVIANLALYFATHTLFTDTTRESWVR
jgi:chromate transporter